MILYRICPMTADGSPDEEIEIDCEHDDAAIDYTGWLNHSHEIQIWNGQRLVACFQNQLTFRSLRA